MPNENTKAGQIVQHNIEFYLVALSFTIAGFAIQTMDLSGKYIIDCCFFISIALIIASAVLGIYRIDRIPALYRSADQIDNAEILMQTHQCTREQIQQHHKNVKDYEGFNNSLKKLYHWNRGIFLLGLTALFLVKFWIAVSQYYMQ